METTVQECALWLQTHVDGEHAANFIHATQNQVNFVATLDRQRQCQWLVNFWVTELAKVGQTTIQATHDYYNMLAVNEGIPALMEYFRQIIEIQNLPRL